MLVSSFANRLNKAMKLRKMKAMDIVNESKLLFLEHKIKKPLNNPLITNYLKGKYEAKQDNIYTLASILDVDEAWLQGYDVSMERKPINTFKQEEKQSSAIVFIYGSIPAGVPMELIEDVVDTEEIPIEMLKGGKEYFGLLIKGDSMYPEYREGDIIICQKVQDCENGDECVVMINGNEGTFKKVLKNEKGIILQPLNPDYQPIIYTNEEINNLPVRVIGKVVQLRRNK